MSAIIFEQIKSESSILKELYELLDSRKYSISHESLPSFEDHKEFVENHPYRFWWILRKEKKAIGTAYITRENGIGINLKVEEISIYQKVIARVTEEFDPLPAIPSVRPHFFFVNAPPSNTSLNQALEKLGYRVTQKTYKVS